MACIMNAIYCLFLPLFLACYGYASNTKQGWFVKVANAAKTKNITHAENVSSATECGAKCLVSDGVCKSFNLRRIEGSKSKICELNGKTDREVDIASSDIRDYFYRKRGSCKAGQVEFDSACYLIVQTKMDFPGASQFCQNQGGHLVSILSVAENSFLLTKVKRDLQVFWIVCPLSGLRSTNNNYSTWTDGSLVGYYNFNNGEPNYLRTECVNMGRELGWRWNDGYCDRKYASICKFRLD